MSENNETKVAMTDKIKNAVAKPVNFVKSHKGAILGAAAGVIAGVAGTAVAVLGMRDDGQEWEEDVIEYDEYYTDGDDSDTSTESTDE